MAVKEVCDVYGTPGPGLRKFRTVITEMPGEGDEAFEPVFAATFTLSPRALGRVIDHVKRATTPTKQSGLLEEVEPEKPDEL